jgi:PAS domain S-box-containing protein
LDAARRRVSDFSARYAGPNQRPGDLASALADFRQAVEELSAAGESLARPNETLASGYQQLEAESWRYRDLFELVPTAYVVTNERGIIQAANRACARLLNTRQEFLTGKPLYVYVEKDQENDFFALFRELRENGEVKDRLLRLRPRRSAPVAVAVVVAARYFDRRHAAGANVELYWLLRDLTRSCRRCAVSARKPTVWEIWFTIFACWRKLNTRSSRFLSMS